MKPSLMRASSWVGLILQSNQKNAILSGLSYRLPEESFTKNGIFRFWKLKMLLRKSQGKLRAKRVCVVCMLYDVFCVCVCVCVCYRPLVYGVCTNDEVLEFQPRTVILPKPGSVAYCYIPIIDLPYSPIPLSGVFLGGRGSPTLPRQPLCHLPHMMWCIACFV